MLTKGLTACNSVDNNPDRPRPSDTNLGESRLYQKEIAAVTNTELALSLAS